MIDLAAEREIMIRQHLMGRGITDQAVLSAMRQVPREEFVLPEYAAAAYGDFPLAIGEGQTISQPYIVAYMAESLELHEADKVLEIGTGSGYSAAVLSRIAKEVHTVEHFDSLASRAKHRLQRLGYTNVRVHLGDGTLGWGAEAPYQAIQVTAGAPHVPAALSVQLAVGGRLVIPVGDHQRMQYLVRVRRLTEKEFHTERLCGVQFVPLVGKDGWSEPM